MSAADAEARRAPSSGRRVDPRIAGLYAVTPDLDDTPRLVAMVDAALAGGARLVQYRHKTADPALRADQARRLAVVCAARGRPLIINDHVELALAIDAAGLHVGSEDVSGPDELRMLRERLGPSRILGVSCYRSVDLARDAADAGADYAAFGSVFASPTKPAAPSAALEPFAAPAGLGIALVGIGGITRVNLRALVEAGADAAAVITDLFGADDGTIEDRARALAGSFDRAA